MEPQASTSPERSALDEFLGRQPSSKRMRQLRKAAPVVGLLLLAGIAALYFTGRSSDQTNYATTPVQRGDLRVTVSATWDDHDFLWNDACGATLAKQPQHSGKIALSTAFFGAYRRALALGF